jgi:hypothetical protein
MTAAEADHPGHCPSTRRDALRSTYAAADDGRRGWATPGRSRVRPFGLIRWEIGGRLKPVDTTGAVREAKLVTAVDGQSRFCVIAKVVERGAPRSASAYPVILSAR